MASAITVCAAAYRQANLEQPLASFEPGQEYPYNIALDLLNTVIQDMNRRGNYGFTQTRTELPYTPGTHTYPLDELGIDPGRISQVRREGPVAAGELRAYNWRKFQQLYRHGSIPQGQPAAWAKFGLALTLNVSPDQDYALAVYHFKDMPPIQHPGDAMMVPAADDDILRDGVYAYLLQRLGRPDFTVAYQLFESKLRHLLAAQKRDAGLPAQLPAGF